MSDPSPRPSDSADAIRSSGGGPFIPPKIGTMLGRYEIISPIGHGAMATVFRARDVQLGREVAVKVMSMALATRGGAGERFRREAQAVASLRHPSILEIHDFVPATEEEPSYIVAELISGPTLRKVLEEHRGRLLPEVAALIALPLAEALAAAHERGVIHRDLKPDNVMIEPRGEKSRVVLTDFGVAHITGMETMTASGALVGSPAYMSPEQARARDVGPSTDLWALGALIYEMVTGVLPFAGKDPFTVITAIVRGTFRKPSQVVATVGPDFETIILRCLKCNPAERYMSAGLLADDLRAFLRRAGILNEAQSLRQFLDAPDAFEKELRPKIADLCLQRARQHIRRGELARALLEIGHATAYMPKHAGAERLLRRLSVGRMAMKVLTAILGLTLVFAGVMLFRPLLRPQPKAPTEIPTPSLSNSKTPENQTREEPPTGLQPTALEKPTSAVPEVPARALKKAKNTSARGKVAALPAPLPDEIPAPALPPPVELEHPTRAIPVKAPEIPKPGTIALFVKRGFCYPSLDNFPVKGFMPVYEDLTPGLHKVYCSRTLQSAREYVGEVELPPGSRIERTVIEQGGKLRIARPR